jgi:hypothetical protein
MEEQFIGFNNPDFETVIVILDASESAEKDWSVIVELAKKIFLKTPAEIEKKLFFLSNSQEFEIKKFESNVGKWWKQNCKKGSFVTPILNQVKNGKIIIIGSGIIYDLEDWIPSEISKRLFFVKTSESMRGDLEIGTEIDIDSFDGQLSNLYNRILSVKISGDDFLPYYWDNPDYSLTFGDDITLNSTKSKNFSIRIAAFGENIKASVEKGEGTENFALQSHETELPGIINLIENYGMKWQKLEKDEIETFKHHLISEPVTCPSCGNVITRSLKCNNQDAHGTLLGWRFYRSLTKNKKGFVIFKDCTDGVFFKEYVSDVIKIGDETVAINKKSKAVISRYNAHTKKWEEQEDLKLYYPLTGGYYVSII